MTSQNFKATEQVSYEKSMEIQGYELIEKMQIAAGTTEYTWKTAEGSTYKVTRIEEESTVAVVSKPVVERKEIGFKLDFAKIAQLREEHEARIAEWNKE